MRAAMVGIVASLALLAPEAAPAAAPGEADVAALQVGLRVLGLYQGDVDGLAGDQTAAGLRELPGATTPLSAATKTALGDFGSHPLGSRELSAGTVGWDVAALQFLLAWHGFPCGALDGSFGRRTTAALVGFQQWAGVPPIGVAGPLTLAALRAEPPTSPLRLAWPLSGTIADGFGPRGVRFHAGIDIPAPSGTPVVAAGDGVVVSAGWRDGGFGKTVEIEHEQGVTTLYVHLSTAHVKPKQRVARGAMVGLVGSTGNATGPHLHFEVHVRGAAVDPLSALDSNGA
jgi:murein DD-endopeptidase MepM/ murein hydrolase activator NlpD